MYIGLKKCHEIQKSADSKKNETNIEDLFFAIWSGVKVESLSAEISSLRVKRFKVKV